eukprot:gene211-227_t
MDKTSPDILEGGRSSFEPIPIRTSTSVSSRTPDWYHWGARHWVWLLPSLIMLKLLGAALFFLIFVQFFNGSSSSLTSNSLSGKSRFAVPLVNLRQLIHTVSLNAIADGSLKTKAISTSIVNSQGLKFVVCKLLPKTPYSGNIVDQSQSSTAQPVLDPFAKDRLEQSLVVHNFHDDQSDSFRYTMILNKFNTIPDHALIVSHDFIPQIRSISKEELILMYWTIRTIGGVAWYNSNALSGASQLHKHLQVLPIDELWKLRKDDSEYAHLLDDLILPHIEMKQWEKYSMKAFLSGQQPKVHHVSEFPFLHGVVALDKEAGTASIDYTALGAYGDYLHHVYQKLLGTVGLTTKQLDDVSLGEFATDEIKVQRPVAYNIIVTEDYIFMVARNQLAHRESVNSMGFLGLLLASSEQSLASIRDEGGLSTLVAVSKPGGRP